MSPPTHPTTRALPLSDDLDIIACRQTVREIAAGLKFDHWANLTCHGGERTRPQHPHPWRRRKVLLGGDPREHEAGRATEFRRRWSRHS